MINDISTDLESPPRLFEVRSGTLSASELRYPPKFREVQKAKYPDLGPLLSSDGTELIYQAVLRLARERFEVVAENPEQRRLQAVAVTRLLRFRDDVAIEVRDTGERREVHMRSRSRVGASDFGANAKRIRGFLDELAGRLSKPARPSPQSLPN